MKHFWALPAALRVALVLAAEQHSFNINDDLLAYPQYEIQFSDDYVLEEVAKRRLQHDSSRTLQSHQDTTSSTPSSHVERYRSPEQTTDHSEQDEHYYEQLNLMGVQYLCAIPDVVVEDIASNANDTAKLEQEKELVRANARGWELMTGMRGICVYYHVDWWSYKYCYDTGARQFHMLPHARNAAAWPPIEDPNVPGFDMGVQSKAGDGQKGSEVALPQQGGLEVNGDSRYLVQRLEGGDKCDLTTLKRKTEVQFYCNQAYAVDVITQVKELSTCSYLIVIETPRLCNDVAFQPPQKDKPHNITCKPILQAEQVEDYEYERSLLRIADEEAAKVQSESQAGVPREQWVGDVLIGAHRLVPEGYKVEKSAIVGGKEIFVATIATSDGMTMSKAELEKLKLGDLKRLEELKEEVIRAANGKYWRIDVVDTIKGRQYRGILDDGKDEDDSNTSTKQETTDQSQGSEEEFYKEEL